MGSTIRISVSNRASAQIEEMAAVDETIDPDSKGKAEGLLLGPRCISIIFGNRVQCKINTFSNNIALQ